MRSADRKKWTTEGPYGAPAPIHHATFDASRPVDVRRDQLDLGGRASNTPPGPRQDLDGREESRVPSSSDRTFYQTWHIEPGHAKTPNVIWAGVEPAGLFKSEDRARPGR